MNSVAPVRTIRLADLSPEERQRLTQRSGAISMDVTSVVRQIVEDVRQKGDEAVREYTERFDGVKLDSLEVPRVEIEAALDSIDQHLAEAMSIAASNIRAFHSAQIHPEPVVETSPGVKVWRVWRPIERVGVYVPGGGARYPSTVLMHAVPASVAGCSEIVLCTPPGPDGKVPEATLAAAALSGVTRVFSIGGAQAIAAMAYGTQTIPPVQKIFGPGNVYVTAAKMLVFGDVDIDKPAGPSELVIIADDTADPRETAADLIAQSEHAPDNASVLVTTSESLAEAVLSELTRQLEDLPNRDRVISSFRSNGFILLVEDLAQAVGFVNEYAPEHLQIVTVSPREILEGINNAGSIFLGRYSPVPAGDYAVGSNHVLPTSGSARTFGPLSTEEFGKWVQVQELTQEGLRSISNAVTAMARAENLEGHARAIEVRFSV